MEQHDSLPQSAAPTLRDVATGLKALLREFIETILLATAILIVINTAIGRFRIEGESMKPSIQPDEYVMINRMAYATAGPLSLGQPLRGDVIVFRFPRDESRDFIKRVIGLPGERVEIASGHVYICPSDTLGLNTCTALVEDYLAPEATFTYTGSWTLGEDEYFVLGDNRSLSSDSHTWGTLKRTNIIGKAWLTYWPPANWGPVPHSEAQAHVGAPQR